MTALTRLESRPAHAESIPAAGSLKNTYAQLLLNVDDAQRKSLARTFLVGNFNRPKTCLRRCPGTCLPCQGLWNSTARR